MRVAALDVDGTLIPDALAGPLPAMLVDAALAPRDREIRLAQALRAEDPETDGAGIRASELFAAMLTDVACRAVSAVMTQVWQQQRERVFDFAKPLIGALKDEDYVPMLISGEPEELLAHLAEELSIDRFSGARFEAVDGLYTGGLASTVLAAKDKVVIKLAGGADIAWSRSLAIGNSLGDVELFDRVGQRVAFEPSPALRALARDRGWLIADRHGVLPMLRDRMGLRVESPVRPSLSDVPTALPKPKAAAGVAARRLTDRLLAEVTPRFLSRSAPSADAFDTAVINSTLYGIPVPDRERLIEQTFDNAAQHSSARKKLTLEAILAVVGPEPFHVDAPSDAFGHRNEATWTRLRQMAIHHLHVPDPVAPELTSRLLRLTELGQRRGVVERNVFAHLFALLSLHRVIPGHPLIRDGIASLAEDVMQTDVDDTTHVLAFLHAMDPERYWPQISGARRFLGERTGADCDLRGPGPSARHRSP